MFSEIKFKSYLFRCSNAKMRSWWIIILLQFSQCLFLWNHALKEKYKNIIWGLPSLILLKFCLHIIYEEEEVRGGESRKQTKERRLQNEDYNILNLPKTQILILLTIFLKDYVKYNICINSIFLLISISLSESLYYHFLPLSLSLLKFTLRLCNDL